MEFKNIPKFPGYCPIFTEVIVKKNIKQTDKFTTRRLRKFLERDHHEADIIPIEKKKEKKKIVKIGAFFDKISENKH